MGRRSRLADRIGARQSRPASAGARLRRRRRAPARHPAPDPQVQPPGSAARLAAPPAARRRHTRPPHGPRRCPAGMDGGGDAVDRGAPRGAAARPGRRATPRDDAAQGRRPRGGERRGEIAARLRPDSRAARRRRALSRVRRPAGGGAEGLCTLVRRAGTPQRRNRDRLRSLGRRRLSPRRELSSPSTPAAPGAAT